METADEMPDVGVEELRALYTLTDRLYRASSMQEVFDAALDAITETLNCKRASILLFDDDGVMRFKAVRGISDEYRQALEGHTPWQPGEMYPAPIFVRDIDETDEPDWITEIIKQEGIRSLGFIPITSAGRLIGKFMTYYRERTDFPRHETELAIFIARQIGFSLEREHADRLRREYERELRHSEARFRLMSENAPVMIWISDANGACLHLNRMLREIWGVSEEEIASFDWRSTMHPDDASTIVEAVSTGTSRQQAFSVKGRYLTTDGSYRVFLTTARPHFSSSGRFLGMIGVNVDVTEQEEAAAQRELIFNELNHRVKNTLAIVQAIAHRTLKDVENRKLVREFEGRLANLAAAHNLLTKSNWENAPLQQLLSDALMMRGNGSDRYLMDGPDVSLPPKQALAIAMAIHELNTNAIKYGALSTDHGVVDLEWMLADDQVLDLVWRERQGPPVVAPQTRGFGTFMIERVLANDIEGNVSLEFRPEGLQCLIRAPLSRGRDE